ncbi:hypothetical protein E2C01_094191 [Portunus trituberculatus]|uniref:Uncharacterized protein n=1 Tax=Portunus trituberculatus TaxID=210409 RepID=A0A5B7K0Y2_PORTR|nr:hypothetical protein [Portunus trituberculatus]
MPRDAAPSLPHPDSAPFSSPCPARHRAAHGPVPARSQIVCHKPCVATPVPHLLPGRAADAGHALLCTLV